MRLVVAQEPECAPAWALLARLYHANHAFELTDVDTPVDQSIAFAQQGVRLDATNPRARRADHLRRGEDEEAYRAALECRDPAYYIKPAELQERVVEGLRKAGLTLA